MIEVSPLTPERWDDFETLMGPRGGADGCWCMLWRNPARVYREMRGEENRDAMKSLVADRPTGLIAYLDGAPSGWISIGPRSDFVRMKGSRIVAPVDDLPVWSVTCFFVAKHARRQGVPAVMLDAACAFAESQGAEVVEGYPTDPLGETYVSAFAWTGYMAVFESCGFSEVARRSEKRPIMRRVL